MGAMSDTVIDFVRRPQAQRRGGELQQVTFDTAFLNELPDTAAAQQGSVLESDRALSALEALDPDLAKLVELRFHGGCTDVEVGQALAASRWVPQPGDRLGSLPTDRAGRSGRHGQRVAGAADTGRAARSGAETAAAGPGNSGGDGRPVRTVLDFGIAQGSGEAQPQSTGAPCTPDGASPEQLAGAPPAASSDG